MTKELKRMYKLAGLINENADNSNGVHINGKKVNVKSIEIDGVDRRDYPDFVDAYISYAEYEDGTELSDAELEELGGDGELVNELIFDRQLYLEENSNKSDEAKSSEDVPAYEGPEDPMDNQVTEDMIQEGELGKAIARILKEELFKK